MIYLSGLLYIYPYFCNRICNKRKGDIMENVQWKVEGMDCSSCALTIHKYLEKQGMKNVKVNSVSGDVSFELNGGAATPKLGKRIQ